LWAIIRAEENTIFGIKNWEVYRRATEVSKEIPTSKSQKKSGKDSAKDQIPVVVLRGGLK